MSVAMAVRQMDQRQRHRGVARGCHLGEWAYSTSSAAADRCADDTDAGLRGGLPTRLQMQHGVMRVMADAIFDHGVLRGEVRNLLIIGNLIER